MVQHDYQIHLMLHPTQWYNGWLALTEGVCRWVVGSGATSDTRTVNLHTGTLCSPQCKTRFHLEMSSLIPHLLEPGRYYAQTLCRARVYVYRGGLLAAPSVCAGTCQDLLLGWDTMTSGNRMGGCDSTDREKERSCKR